MNQPKGFRIWNSNNSTMLYFDMFELVENILEPDGIYDAPMEFTGKLDNSNNSNPLYDLDHVKIIIPKILTDNEISYGIVGYDPDYAAYGIMVNGSQPILISDCVKQGSIIVKIGNYYESKLPENKTNSGIII